MLKYNLLYILCVVNYMHENEIRNMHANNFWKCEQNIGIRVIYEAHRVKYIMQACKSINSA
jgi:hypothetical protein